MHLEPKVMSVLVCLAELPGQTVSKEKLLQTTWPETFVSEDVLVRAVGELRRVFEDNAKEPRVIQTIAKRGYRLLAPVVPLNCKAPQTSGNGAVATADPDPNTGSAPDRRMMRLGVLLSLGISALLVAILGFAPSKWWQRLQGGIDDPQIRSIAVLPLQNLSSDPSQEYFSDGMTDELITELSRVSTLKVISRTSSMHFKKTERTLQAIASELGVDAIVDGSVLRSGDQVRVTAQLIYVPQDRNLWANSYQRNVRDVFALDRDVAEDIAQQVRVRLPSTHNRLNTLNSESQDLYLQGLYSLQQLTKSGVEKGIFYFNRSLQIEPRNALAHVELAEAYCWMGDLNFLSANEAYPQAKKAALSAMQLDDSLAEPHAFLGWISYVHDWDKATAEKEFLRSLSLNSNYPNAHVLYGIYLARNGRAAESRREFEQARQLDPLSLLIRTEEWLPFYFSRQFDKAIEASQHVLEMDPSFVRARDQLVYLYELTGRLEDAIQENERLSILEGEEPASAVRTAASFRRALRNRGAAGYWQLRLNSQIGNPMNARVDLMDKAFVSLHLHNKADALILLTAAYDAGTLEIDLDKDPAFDELKSDVRFQKLMGRSSPRS